MSNNTVSRRGFIGSGAAVAASGLVAASAADKRPTAAQSEGPFYPTHKALDKDGDMTVVKGKPGTATGDVLVLSGHVLDTDGNPVEGAVVDIWQADSKGRYLHDQAPETSPLDPAFQYWAQLKTGADGSYSVKTIMPAQYAAIEDWVRPPHIHFKVARRGMHELTTQMYFEGHELNEQDRLFMGAPEDARHTLLVAPKDGKATFDLVLRKV